MPTDSLVISRNGSSSTRVLLRKKRPNRTSLITDGLNEWISEMASVRFRSLRFNVTGETRLFGSGNGSKPGKFEKKNVPLSVLFSDGR